MLYEPTGFAGQIFKDRYAIHPDETFQEACERVAKFAASAEDGDKIKPFENRFMEILSHNRGSVGGRIWRNAGRKKGACANCYVVPVEDSREGWGQLLKEVTIISGIGGGVGISFDNIRPRGSEIKGIGGIATGAVSLMKIVNGVCNELRSGGSRRSALLFGLSYWHPDIEEFLDVKLDKKELNNANVSVMVDDKFFDLVETDGDIELVFQGKTHKKIKARWLYDRVTSNALKSGDPGFLNLGYANKMNNLYYCRPMSCSNPSMPSGTLVLTRDGIIPIQQLENQTFYIRDINNKWVESRCFLSGNNEEVFELDFGGGKKIYATKEHDWPILDSYGRIHKIKTKDLRPKDRVLAHHNNQLDLHGDNSLTEDEGFFVGTITAGVGTVDSQEQIEKYGFDSDQNHIPSCIWRSNDEFIKGFIDGIFSACGSVDTVKKSLTLTQLSNTLLQEISQLLSFYGIYGIHSEQDSTYCTYRIREFRNIFNLSNAIKQNKINTITSYHACHSLNGLQYLCLKSITYHSRQDVWDISVYDDNHIFPVAYTYTGNCAEQLLAPYSVCCLGSVILSSHVTDKGDIDLDLLGETVLLMVRLLDNVIDMTEYPFPAIKEWSQKERRIGLGVAGLHDMLLKMGIKYSSDEAIAIIDKVMNFVKKKAYEASIFLAVEKGQFPLLDRGQFVKSGFCQTLTQSIRAKILEYGIRNSFLLTLPPTGTTSIVANCSSGIEPMFAPIYRRTFNRHTVSDNEVKETASEIVIHPLLLEFVRAGKNYDHFEGAHEISPEQHCRVQLACQKHICSGVSKTINLPENATQECLSDIILKYMRSLKGMTVFRHNSKGTSPLEPIPISDIKEYLEGIASEITSNECPNGICEL